MFNKAPEIDVRKYLTEDECADFDHLKIASTFTRVSPEEMSQMDDLRKVAYSRFLTELTSKKYTGTRRDRVVGWLSNRILRLASVEYQTLLWATFRVGMNKLKVEGDA